MTHYVSYMFVTDAMIDARGNNSKNKSVFRHPLNQAKVKSTFRVGGNCEISQNLIVTKSLRI